MALAKTRAEASKASMPTKGVSTRVAREAMPAKIAISKVRKVVAHSIDGDKRGEVRPPIT